MCFEKAIKKFDVWDIGLVKFSVLFAVLWLIALFPDLATWIVSVNPWWFFVLMLVAMARPLYRAYFKKK
ncbi:MAG: hypothetical protein WC462_04720 [archaeon]